MTCTRCGDAEIATESVFIVGYDRDPDLISAIDAALWRHGIEGVNGLAQLCARCWEIADAAIDAGGRSYFATRRDVIQQHYEANLGRPLTSTERDEMDAYFDGADDEGSASWT
jgi:hypothetical protein